MKISRVVFVAFVLFSFIAVSLAQQGDEEIDAVNPTNLSDESANNQKLDSTDQDPKQKPSKPTQNPSQTTPDQKPGNQDSQVNAGNIKVVLKSSKVISNPLTEGIKYKIAISWDMTFSQFIKRTGFRYTVGDNKLVRYAVHNRLLDPFQMRQSQRWMAEDFFTLDKQHAALQTVEAQIWFVTQNGQRWDSQPFKIQVAENKGFFGLGKDTV